MGENLKLTVSTKNDGKKKATSDLDAAAEPRRKSQRLSEKETEEKPKPEKAPTKTKKGTEAGHGGSQTERVRELQTEGSGDWLTQVRWREPHAGGALTYASYAGEAHMLEKGPSGAVDKKERAKADKETPAENGEAKAEEAPAAEDQTDKGKKKEEKEDKPEEEQKAAQ
ncbi:caldesmon-like [Cyprinodon tularosa]|uniref:caldesmon-like n=1 Tax=Cyprinodon tularosa TaxID=77115 RepID=UPI0018E1E173|nr:caldesmon-like [Cyprinodon tularosa]